MRIVDLTTKSMHMFQSCILVASHEIVQSERIKATFAVPKRPSRN